MPNQESDTGVRRSNEWRQANSQQRSDAPKPTTDWRKLGFRRDAFGVQSENRAVFKECGLVRDCSQRSWWSTVDSNQTPNRKRDRQKNLRNLALKQRFFCVAAIYYSAVAHTNLQVSRCTYAYLAVLFLVAETPIAAAHIRPPAERERFSPFSRSIRSI